MGVYYAASWPGFKPQRVIVRGNAVVPTAHILALARIDRQRNLWLQNMRAAADRIKAIPFVGDVRILRGLPATATIEVSERKPYAVVDANNMQLVVDDQLRVLAVAQRRPELPLLVVPVPPRPAGTFLHDARLRAMLRDYQTLRAADVLPSLLYFDRLGDLNAVLRTGVVLRLGSDEDLAQKAGLIAPILSQTQEHGRRLRALDLRAPKTPIVQFRQ
ncbi:MAG: hypothetical protein NVS1B14_05340 [Vulcanimicrobiaceae bacterium]